MSLTKFLESCRDIHGINIEGCDPQLVDSRTLQDQLKELERHHQAALQQELAIKSIEEAQRGVLSAESIRRHVCFEPIDTLQLN